MKKLILLGASGSIGQQTIEVLKKYPHDFSLEAFSVGNNSEQVENIINTFNVKAVFLFDENYANKLKSKYPNIHFFNDDINQIFEVVKADMLVNAIVGIAGLLPTVNALKNGLDIAIANKESLVVGGELITDLAKENNANIYPVDSEHSAIWQALSGNDKADIHSITLTASGGSFRDLSRKDLANVTKAEALAHPNWSMGAKITIDSATMMNKGLEIIEAHYLFDLDYSKINTLIHHQSIIHSYVEFNDYSIIAQMGTADMKIPIQFALTYPKHKAINNNERLDLAEVSKLTFAEVDFKRYPLVKLAYEVGKSRGSLRVVMNAANEVAVDLFLNDKISFLEIETLVIKTTNKYPDEKIDSFEAIFKLNAEVVNDVKANYQAIIKMEEL